MSNWFPRLLADPSQLNDNVPFGADASDQQNPISGLLGSTPQPQQDEPTTLLGYEKCLKENSL